MNKEQIFIDSIEAIKTQSDFDKEYVQKLSSIYGTEHLPLYNNSAIVESLINTISNLFSNPRIAKEEINHYVYDMNFGRFGSNDFITSEDVYSRIKELIQKQ